MVKSAERVCDILKLLAPRRDGLRHAEIARALKIPSSSLSGLLASLLEQQFLSLNALTQRYSLGPQILSLAGSYLEGLDVVEQSKPVVKKLAEETGESAALSIRCDWDIMTAFKEDSRQLIKRTLQIGERQPMHATASGKAILAHLDEREIEEFLSTSKLVPITAKTITDPKVLRKELAEIRVSGLAYNREEVSDQIIAIGAPVFDLFGKVVASLVVSSPVTRFTGAKETLIQNAVKEASESISRRLGFKGKTLNEHH